MLSRFSLIVLNLSSLSDFFLLCPLFLYDKQLAEKKYNEYKPLLEEVNFDTSKCLSFESLLTDHLSIFLFVALLPFSYLL